MNGRLIEAQESERARIARDLHDDISQRLALLTLELEQVKGLQPDSSSEARGRLDALQKRAAEITADVQALSHELHSPRLLHLGVVAAMRGFCEELSGQKHIGIDFGHENVPESVPPDVSLCLFRVLQEALHNGVRHSRTPHFDVHLRGTGDVVHLTVRDEGVGFDVNAASRGQGLGLTSMKERLKLVVASWSSSRNRSAAPPFTPARWFSEVRRWASPVWRLELMAVRQGFAPFHATFTNY